MATWHDWVTNRRYVCDASWERHVRQHLAERLREVLSAAGSPGTGSSPPGSKRVAELRRLADTVARFWKWAYCPLVFPIRPSRQTAWPQMERAQLDGDRPMGDLLLSGSRPVRELPLEDRLPPILPWVGRPWEWAATNTSQRADSAGRPSESPFLAAEGALATAAIASALVRPLLPPSEQDEQFHQIRLALLLLPLAEQLDLVLGGWRRSREPVGPVLPHEDEKWMAQVRGLMEWWQTDGGARPDWLSQEVGELLQRLRDFNPTLKAGEKLEPPSQELAVVMVGAHQIKRFVLESSSLPDIRGGSTLLDEAPSRLEELVAELLGPENVIRQEGSFFTCLLPVRVPAVEVPAPGSVDKSDRVSVRTLEQWVDLLCAHYQSHVLSARVFGACVRTDLSELLTKYRDVAWRLWREELRTRDEGQAPVFERLPFEKPCHFCRVRPAEGRLHAPDEPQGVDACSVCARKIEVGRAERARKTRAIYGWGRRLPMTASAGVPEPGRFTSNGDGLPPLEMAETLNELVPPGVEHPLLASVFGDGNQFGELISELATLAHAIHWARRVSATVQGAGCVAMQEAVGSLQLARFPVEVLALGGDDFNLFAWAPVGIRFTQRFMELTDEEFSRASGSDEEKEKGHSPKSTGSPSFSVGVLVAHVRSPVLFTMDFAEHELLEWAKRARRLRIRRRRWAGALPDSDALPEVGGTAALYVATSLDALPSDLRATLAQVFRKRVSGGVDHGAGGPGTAPYYLTLGPLTAAELGWLMRLAERHQQGQGPLRSLVEAWVRRQPEEALLYSLYQVSRSRRGRDSAGAFLARLARDLTEAERLPDPWGAGEVRKPPTLAGLRLEGARLAALPPLVDEDERGSGHDGGSNGPWWVPVWDLLQLMRLFAGPRQVGGQGGGQP